jgi:predicted metal-dependent phosphoesterase TrpH
MALADLHIHSIFSHDGTASVPSILKRAVEVGLDLIAITDHDVMDGSLMAVDLAPNYGIQAIPGVEISTAEGDLLALSIQSLIPPKLSLLETIMRVGEQGGFCIAPHPMAHGMRMHSLGGTALRKVMRDPDASRILIGVETYNAMLINHKYNDAAETLAERLLIAQTGSSDAHVVGAVGLGATIFHGNTLEHLISALWSGTTQVQKGPRWGAAHVLGSWAAHYLLRNTGLRREPLAA